MGEPAGDGRGFGADDRTVHEATGFELFFGAGYASAYPGRGMGVAGTISGQNAEFLAGWVAVHRSREFAHGLAGTGSATTEVRWRIDAGRLKPGDGVQNAEIRDVQQSAVAIDAARGESRDVPSRTD